MKCPGTGQRSVYFGSIVPGYSMCRACTRVVTAPEGTIIPLHHKIGGSPKPVIKVRKEPV